MKVLHITPLSNGYEEVELLANAYNRNNSLAVIRKNDINSMTGGFLINDTPRIREILDSIPKDQQYDFVKEFKTTPFAQIYFEKE